MRKITFWMGLLLTAVIVFSSCNQADVKAQMSAMPDGMQKDSAQLRYYVGLTKGQMLVALDTFYLNTRADSKYEKNLKEKIIKDGQPREYFVDDFRGPRVLTGDNLMVLGGFKQTVKKGKFLKPDKYDTYIQLRIIRNGKKVADGWSHNNVSYMANPESPRIWNYIWGDKTYELVFIILLISLPLWVLYLIWKLIFKLATRDNEEERFWKNEKIFFQWFYYLVSVLLSFCFFLIRTDGALCHTLRFEPDFFSRWSEYVFVLRALPFLLGLWVISVLAMLWEMIRKYSTLWLLIYYPGVVAFGMLLFALTMIGSFAIYLILPSLLGFAAVMLLGGGSSNKSGGGGGGGSEEKKTVYYDDEGRAHQTNNQANKSNESIRANKGM